MGSLSLEHLALTKTDDFPIRRVGDVHNGKVRSVYWLPQDLSTYLIHKGGYLVPDDTSLGVMITSDRISAFNVVWHGANGLGGVPGKGAALNAMSIYWFEMYEREGLAHHHVLDTPHPLVWIVQKAQPVKIEAVIRANITGSLWKEYSQKHVRTYCGHQLPEGLRQYQEFLPPILTPTTKGTLDLPGIPKKEDAPISHDQIRGLLREFGFRDRADFDTYCHLIPEVFNYSSKTLKAKRKRLADAKFEIGYIRLHSGLWVLGLIDEPVTGDSARIWEGPSYEQGEIIEESKEYFRQDLIKYCDAHVKPHGRKILDGEALLPELRTLASTYDVPVEVMMETSKIYTGLTEEITGKPVPVSKNPREEILDALNDLNLLR